MKFASNNFDGQVWSESAMGYVGGLCSLWCHQHVAIKIWKVMYHVKDRGDDPCRCPWTGLAIPNCSKVSWLQYCQDRSFQARYLSPMFCITRHQSTKSEADSCLACLADVVWGIEHHTRDTWQEILKHKHPLGEPGLEACLQRAPAQIPRKANKPARLKASSNWRRICWPMTCWINDRMCLSSPSILSHFGKNCMLWLGWCINCSTPSKKTTYIA